jgi:hypothetical protein
LKLGASTGRALEQTQTLTTQNEQLRGSVAALGDDQRIERLASAMGMVLPPPGAVGYLTAKPGGNVAGALANLHLPDPAGFVMLPPRDGDGAVITGPGTSTLPPLPGAPPPPTSTASGTTGAGSASASAQTASAQTASAQTQTAQTATGQTASSQSTPQTAQSTSQTPAATQQAPATTSSSPATSNQIQSAPTSATTSPSQGPPTGAAAIQPAGAGSQSSGG